MKGGLTKLEFSAVKDFTASLRDRFPHEIEGIKLYGSKARGNANENSDIDILIVVKKRTEELDEFVLDLICDVLDKHGVYMETVTLTSKDYSDAIRYQYPFAINVERDSVIL